MCVCVFVRARVCACMCERERERERVFMHICTYLYISQLISTHTQLLSLLMYVHAELTHITSADGARRDGAQLETLRKKSQKSVPKSAPLHVSVPAFACMHRDRRGSRAWPLDAERRHAMCP